MSVQLRRTSDDCCILLEKSISMQFLEIDEHPFNVVQSVRPIGMSRKLNLLPRRSNRNKGVLLGQFDFFFNSLDLIGKIQI